MDGSKFYGYHGEGHILCPNCAGRIYGDSLEKYVAAGDLQTLGESDRSPYREKGLMCDECLRWIFRPDVVEAPWWREEPAVEEHLRLLAPFASWLEQLGVEVANLREVELVGPQGPGD